MLSLAQNNGDDHPEAAGKHLADAAALVKARRWDGAAYLTDYVVECALKTFILLNDSAWRHPPGKGHDLNLLTKEALRLAALSTAKTAKYALGISPGDSICDQKNGWRETLRYHPQGTVSKVRATQWLGEAQKTYRNTVVLMRLDGVI